MRAFCDDSRKAVMTRTVAIYWSRHSTGWSPPATTEAASAGPAARTDHPALDRLLDGFEGSEMVVNTRGEDVLVSAKRIPSTDWQVLVTLPGDGVFTPLRAARMHMLLATIVLALVASGAIWLILRCELTPMLTTVKALAAPSKPRSPGSPRSRWPFRARAKSPN